MAKRQRQVNVLVAQRDAQRYATEYISNRPLGLPDLDEETFTKVMDVIVLVIVNAWAAGYMAHAEEG